MNLNWKKLLVAFVSIALCLNAFSQEPVNKKATKEARNLLKYMYSISGKKTLTGQHNMLAQMSTISDSIYRATGKFPAVWGSDFAFAGPESPIDNIEYRKDLVAEMVKQHKRGCIITLTYHQANPLVGEPCKWEGGVFRSPMSEQEWNDMLTEGTEIYEKWRKQMDLLAGYLLQAQKAKIPILFRPYHEMNGDWFWWGKRTGENGFTKLWRNLYHYYTDHHKLNNLVWVWSSDKPWEGVEEYYPGDKYVDILSSDIYPMEGHEVYRQEFYDRMVKLAGDKPIGLGECSIIPDEATLAKQPRWTWFMTWSNMVLNANSPEKIKRVFNSERMVNAGEFKVK